MTALIPGSFDPLTSGHFDIALRAAALFGRAVIAVMSNGEKNGLFSLSERVDIISAAIDASGRKDISVVGCDGLLVSLYEELGADCIVKGIRNSSDYVYENELWLINKSFLDKTETVFLPSKACYSHISSTMVREMLKYGMDITAAMPQGAAQKAESFYKLK